MAIASLVCSLFGWVCIIGGILGIIFGFMALGQIKQRGQGGRGMAIAGIVIGVIVTVIVILVGILGAVSGSLSKTHSSAPAVVITIEQQPVWRLSQRNQLAAQPIWETLGNS
jgi:cell division protein FtsN